MPSAAAHAAAVLLALSAGAAAACPDWQAAPHFGRIALAAGFEPDPHVRRVTAGGGIDLGRCFSGDFRGFVSERPDFDLDWQGRAARLVIAVQSQAAAILLVNAPDGSWHYSGGAGGGGPAILFRDPQPGPYAIWIGTRDGARQSPARLVLTQRGDPGGGE